MTRGRRPRRPRGPAARPRPGWTCGTGRTRSGPALEQRRDRLPAEVWVDGDRVRTQRVVRAAAWRAAVCRCRRASRPPRTGRRPGRAPAAVRGRRSRRPYASKKARFGLTAAATAATPRGRGARTPRRRRAWPGSRRAGRSARGRSPRTAPAASPRSVRRAARGRRALVTGGGDGPRPGTARASRGAPAGGPRARTSRAATRRRGRRWR